MVLLAWSGGIRRYQNKDGSLTNLGIKRLKKNMLSQKNREVVDRVNEKLPNEISKHVIEKDNYDIIKKNTELGRYSHTKNEKKSEKYMFINNTVDDFDYSNFFYENALGNSNSDNKFYKHIYVTSANIKVAKGKDVTDYMLKNYAGEKFKNIMNNEAKKLEIDKYIYNTDYYKYYSKKEKEPKYYKELCKRVDDIIESLNDGANINLYSNKEHRKDIYDHFKKLGYDAITDVEDGYNGYESRAHKAEYPIIIINEEKIKKIKTLEK